MGLRLAAIGSCVGSWRTILAHFRGALLLLWPGPHGQSEMYRGAGPCLIVHWRIGKADRPVALHSVEDRLRHERDASTRRWPLSPQSPLAGGECNLDTARILTQDRLLAMAAPPSSVFQPKTSFAPVDVYEVNLRTGGMGARRRTGFRSPGGRVEEQVLSPAGDRQAWLVMNPNRWTGPAWLRKLWRLAGRRQAPQFEV